MQMTTNRSEQLSGDIRSENAQRVMLHASWQAGRRYSLNVEVLDAEYVQEHSAEVSEAVQQFAENASALARAVGVPV